MTPATIARYLASPDRATRDAMEVEFPGIEAEALKQPVEAAQAREMAELGVAEKDRGNPTLLVPPGPPERVEWTAIGPAETWPTVDATFPEIKEAVAAAFPMEEPFQEKPLVASEGQPRKRGRPRKLPDNGA